MSFAQENKIISPTFQIRCTLVNKQTRKFVFLGQPTKTKIDECCFSKHAHLSLYCHKRNYLHVEHSVLSKKKCVPFDMNFILASTITKNQCDWFLGTMRKENFRLLGKQFKSSASRLHFLTSQTCVRCPQMIISQRIQLAPGSYSWVQIITSARKLLFVGTATGVETFFLELPSHPPVISPTKCQ